MIVFLMRAAGAGNCGRKDHVQATGGITTWEGLRLTPRTHGTTHDSFMELQPWLCVAPFLSPAHREWGWRLLPSELHQPFSSWD
jgi:hypothetical protein